MSLKFRSLKGFAEKIQDVLEDFSDGRARNVFSFTDGYEFYLLIVSERLRHSRSRFYSSIRNRKLPARLARENHR